MDDIATGLERVRARIADAASRAGRDPAEVTVVVVSKGVPAPRVAEAVALGVRDLGENRVQELLAKREALGAAAGVRWHMVGSLQRNKVNAVTGSVALIHSVDSLRLADAIAARARQVEVTQDVLIEVNTSGEPGKHGVAPGEAAALAERVEGTGGLRVRGLMTVAAPDRARARVGFRALREARDALVGLLPEASELSMGMTGDLEEAVEEGATIVRVGTAIFGPWAAGAGVPGVPRSPG